MGSYYKPMWTELIDTKTNQTKLNHCEVNRVTDWFYYIYCMASVSILQDTVYMYAR